MPPLSRVLEQKCLNTAIDSSTKSKVEELVQEAVFLTSRPYQPDRLK